MPKIAQELTVLQVKNLKNPGLHAVGGVPGLLIKIGKQSASDVKPPRSWIYRARVNGRAGVVIKNTFLSNGDAASLRKQLLEECNVTGLLNMPGGTSCVGRYTALSDSR